MVRLWECSNPVMKIIYVLYTKIATFQQTSEDTKPQLVEKEIYYIPIRNLKTVKIEINTLFKKNEFIHSTETKGKDLPKYFVTYKKPRLRDAPVNSKIL